VLAIQNQYPPHHLGGYELSCRDVLEGLVARGHEVTVLASRDRRPGVTDPIGERDGTAPGGVRVWRDLPWWWDDHVLTNPPARSRLRQEIVAQRTLRRALRAVRPDVVSVWNMGAMSLGLLTTVSRRRVPMVFNVCDDWMVYGPNLDAWGRALRRTRPRRLVERVLARLGLPSAIPKRAWPGAYLFVSERTRRAARDARDWDLPASAVVGSGIDHRDFPVTSESIVERPWRWRLLFVGRVEHRKGVATAVRALTHLPDAATLDLIGPPSPEDLAEVQHLVASLGLDERVAFDEVPRTELRDRYVEADAFLFTSEWEEPFGLVPLEAMACDTPVVATGVGGSADFLEDSVNCVLFPPGDARALADAVTRLAADSSLRRHLVEGGRRTAARLGVDSLTTVVAEWHEGAAGPTS
jgi:glycosyltransferase involved in cell wall biosynthesis